MNKIRVKNPSKDKTREYIIKSAIKSSEQTILIVIYNNQNQKRYIGVKIK